VDDLLQQGITAFKAGKREEARKIFSAVVKQNPENSRAWGWMYNASNDDNERIYCVKQMLRIDPKNKQANKLYKELTASKPIPSSKGVALKPIIIIGIALFCLVGFCFVGILFVNINKITSTPTTIASLPIEKIIESTISAADTQTAISYSPTPLVAATIAPSLESISTVTQVPAATQIPTFTPVPVFTQVPVLSNTPFVFPTSTRNSSSGSNFDNNGDGKVTCADFSTQSQALVALKAGHTNLDSDGDGIPCESLPQ